MAETKAVPVVEGNVRIGGMVLAHCCFCEATHGKHQLTAEEKRLLEQKGEVVTGSRTADLVPVFTLQN
jgi:hypothetical protein